MNNKCIPYFKIIEICDSEFSEKISFKILSEPSRKDLLWYNIDFVREALIQVYSKNNRNLSENIYRFYIHTKHNFSSKNKNHIKVFEKALKDIEDQKLIIHDFFEQNGIDVKHSFMNNESDYTVSISQMLKIISSRNQMVVK